MVDFDKIQSEVADARGRLSVSWRDFALLCKARMIECAITSDGITSYSIGGRTVTRDLSQWQEWYEYALKQASIEEGGGPQMQTIYFPPRAIC